MKSRQKVAKISNLKGGVGNFFPGGGGSPKGGVVCQGGVIPPLPAMVNELTEPARSICSRGQSFSKVPSKRCT